MTTREDSRKALGDMLQGLHVRYQERLKRDDEFTVIEYAAAQTPPISVDTASLEINKLLQLGAVEFSRKVVYQNKERNAYKFVKE